MFKQRPILLALMLALCGTAHAGVQKCKDEQGKVFYSDRGCPNGEKVRTAPGSRDTGAGNDEAIAQRCLEHVRVTTGEGTADSTRLESFRVKWVSVRDVGARRLFDITVAYRNPAGYWGETHQFKCLLRGDNTTFQTTPYELVD